MGLVAFKTDTKTKTSVKIIVQPAARSVLGPAQVRVNIGSKLVRRLQMEYVDYTVCLLNVSVATL